MGEAIPDTYILYMCAYMAIKLGHGDDTDNDAHAETALTKLLQPAVEKLTGAESC